MIGISPSEINILNDIFAKLASECDVLVFGSRHKNIHREGSDLDLAVKTSNKIPLGFDRLIQIKEALEESDLPYAVDVLDYYALPINFQEIIDRGHYKLPKKSH